VDYKPNMSQSSGTHHTEARTDAHQLVPRVIGRSCSHRRTQVHSTFSAEVQDLSKVDWSHFVDIYTDNKHVVPC